MPFGVTATPTLAAGVVEHLHDIASRREVCDRSSYSASTSWVCAPEGPRPRPPLFAVDVDDAAGDIGRKRLAVQGHAAALDGGFGLAVCVSVLIFQGFADAGGE
jgi:hypothetical protein